MKNQVGNTSSWIVVITNLMVYSQSILTYKKEMNCCLREALMAHLKAAPQEENIFIEADKISDKLTLSKHLATE